MSRSEAIVALAAALERRGIAPADALTTATARIATSADPMAWGLIVGYERHTHIRSA